MKFLPLAAAAATLLVATPIGAQSMTGVDERPDIVDAASGAPQFSTLVDLVVAAGLVDALQANGPLTVFAPNNDAFAPILGDPPTGDALVDVLTYHVVAGRYPSGRLIAAAKKSPGGVDLETLNGDTINARLANGELILTDGQGNEIGVVTTDINTANGVIHEIDGVLLPPAE